jgi:energy-coupling factor transport system permease protein
VVGSAIQAIPRLAERAREVTDSQRARGLDTEGSPWRRVRGVVPLAGPLITGALSEVEERTMALEARGFSAPARRATLRPMADDGNQRLLRWLLALATIVLIAATIAGRLALP